LNEITEAISTPRQPGDNEGLLWWFKEYHRQQGEWEKDASRFSAISGKAPEMLSAHGATPTPFPAHGNQPAAAVEFAPIPLAAEIEKALDAQAWAEARRQMTAGPIWDMDSKRFEPAQRAIKRARSGQAVPLRELGPQVEDLNTKFLATQQVVSEIITDVGVRYGAAVQDILSLNGTINASFDATWNGLQTGFGTAAANLANRAQTIRSAIHTILSSLEQEALAVLARIGAAAAFRFAFGGIPGFLTAMGYTAKPGASAKTAVPSGRIGGTTVVHIYGYDVRSAYQDLVNGNLGEAQVQLRSAREY
jgi:hypothetical protein